MALSKWIRWLYFHGLGGSATMEYSFNAADIIVVGRFTGNQALAAVGSTSALINLLVNMFIGISVGANVVLGKSIGARDEENTSKAVHTAIFIASLVDY